METILPKQHDDKQAETKGSNSIGFERIYEKPVLSPLGHMAQVTQKSGIEPDFPETPTRS